MAKEGYLKQRSEVFTNAVRGEFEPDQESYKPLVPSIAISAVFEQEGPGQNSDFMYSRIGNPTRKVLERSLAKIEHAKFALCFSSGMGALTTLTCLLSSGDHIVAGEELYGGSTRLFKKIFSRMNIQVSFVDTRDNASLEAAIKENTKLVLLESPTNPLLKVTDIAQVSKIVHKHKDVLLAVDNTFATPYFQRPLDLGADISMLSLAKYMNGHNDVVMGSLATNSDQLYEQLYFLQHGMGITPSPFDCYQVYRGLKTLPLRMEQHMKNSIIIANYLETKSQVEKVVHPGLSSHPQYELTKRQCYGTSGMLSFYIKGGLSETKLFIKSLKMINYAGSLGGYSSTMIVPYLMSHASMPIEEKMKLGITDNLVRMSVGLESTADIIADIEQALEHINN